jgi:hypothetical protein
VILVEWSEFAVRFARELAGLDRDTILIVREHDESRHYVQAMRETERLYAEAVSNNFLDGPLALTPADEEVLAEAGWRPPTIDWSPANWWTELALDAPPGAHAELADMMVTALRDVQGVRRPADLVYESFHRDGYGLIELVEFGIAAADPGRITERRSSAPDRDDGPDTAENAEHPDNAAAAGRAGTAGQTVAAGQAAAAEAPADGDPGLRSGEETTAGLPMETRAERRAERILAAPPSPEGSPPAPYRPSEQEIRLVDALRIGDAAACYEQFLAAELVLPATGQAVEDPSLAEFTTAVVDGETRVPAFTSPAAMARACGERAGLHRKTTFPELAAAWPDPSWSLVINGGLPSEVRVDAVTVARLDEMRRTAEQASTVDALVGRPEPRPITLGGAAAADAPVPPGLVDVPGLPGADAEPAAVHPLPVPHGAQLWRLTDATPDAIPLAKYDAAAGRWIATESLPQVRS